MANNLIPSDGTSVFTTLLLKQPAEDAMFVYPSPLPSGIGGMVFDVRGEERIELKSEITDHWLEDNTAIHDQIALYPEKVTLKGSTGDLVYNRTTISQPITQTLNSLPANGAMQPQLTPGAQQALSQSISTTQTLTTTSQTNAYQYYLATASAPNNKQALIFGYLYSLWQGRQLFTVETPWGIFTSMAIESCEPIQSEITQNVTDFTVTFKKVRILGASQASQIGIAGTSQDITSADQGVDAGTLGTSSFNVQQVEAIAQDWLSSSINDILKSALGELNNPDNDIAVAIQTDSSAQLNDFLDSLESTDSPAAQDFLNSLSGWI
jgi:hypothetical protein